MKNIINTVLQHKDQKTPQNIKELLKDIGENTALFYLYFHFNDKGWSIYKNYDEKGYDILLQKDTKKIKIEVKTRQRIICSSKNKNRITHFTLSEAEKNNADILIAYWFEHGNFFIVPTNELKKTKSNNKILYKFVVSLDKNKKPYPESRKYLDKWKLITENRDSYR
jgi:hypothetical protein